MFFPPAQKTPLQISRPPFGQRITITVLKKVKNCPRGLGFCQSFWPRWAAYFCKIFPPEKQGFDHDQKVPAGCQDVRAWNSSMHNPTWTGGAKWPITRIFLYSSETVKPIFTKFCDFHHIYTWCPKKVRKFKII